MLKAQFIFQVECNSAHSLEVSGRKEMSVFTKMASMNVKRPGHPLSIMKQELLGDTRTK